MPPNEDHSLFGTSSTYGGDGRTSFGLPDLRGRAPIGPRSGPGLSNYRLGQRGGVETVLLNQTQIPSHSHALRAKAGEGDETNPGAGTFLAKSDDDLYAEEANTTMGATTNAGGNQSHANMQPFLSINYIIAMQGIFPSRS